MSRFLIGVVVLLAMIYLFLLGWSAAGVSSSLNDLQDLSLDPLQLKQTTLENELELKLSGTGFNQATRVFSHMDVNNQSAIVGSFPVPGIVFDMERIGDLIYVASNTDGLRAFDVSDPLKPVMLPTHNPVNTLCLDIERKNRDLYLSCGTQGLKICRSSKKGGLGGWLTLPTYSAAVASKVVGHYLYVAAGKAGLLFYDLEKLETKRPIAVFESGYSVRGIDSFGDYIYSVTGKGGVGIFKRGEDGLLSEVNRLSAKKFVKSITISGNSLYVLENNKLSQYDLQQPHSPRLFAEQEHYSSPQRLFCFGNDIFVADNHSGLGFVKEGRRLLSDTAQFMNLGGDSRAAVKVADLLYIAVANSGIKILDLNKIVPRQVVETIKTPGLVGMFKIIGDHIFIADRSQGVSVHNLADPEFKGKTLSHIPVKSLALFRDRLFVISAISGTEVYDVTDPSDPEKIATWPELRGNDLAVNGELLFVSQGGRGLEVSRMNDLDSPRFLERKSDDIAVWGWSKGDLVIAAGEREGVRFYKMEKDRLVFLSQLQLPFPLNRFSRTLKFQVKGEILFVANGDAGLMIVDIKNPEHPEILSSLRTPGQATDLLVEGDLLYLLSRYSGLHTIDINNLKEPRLVDSLSLSDVWRGIERHGDLLYLGNRFMGVTAIPFPREIKKVELVSSEKLVVTVPAAKFPGRYSLQISSPEKVVAAEGVVTFQ